MQHVDFDQLQRLGVRHLDQYFGLWAIEEHRFSAMVERISRMDLTQHVQANSPTFAASRGARSSSVSGQIAVIEINGAITKYGSSLGDENGAVGIRRLIRSAAADPDVDAIMLKIDSPGGSVAGIADVAADVRAAAGRKPVHAFIEDLGASAAYWIASQADRITANNGTALIGSIGVFSVLYDTSGEAAMRGVKANVVKSTGATHKGGGAWGTDLTGEQIAHWQTIIDETQAMFSQAVSDGRKLSLDAVAKLADGAIHHAATAEQLKLIDGIRTWDQAVSELAAATTRRRGSSGSSNANHDTSAGGASAGDPDPNPAAEPASSQQEDQSMTDQNKTAQAATVQELKAAFPDATSDFREKCLEDGLTMAAAKDRYLDQLRAEKESRDAELEAANKELAELKKDRGGKLPGASAVPEGKSPDDEDAAAGYTDAKAEVQARKQKLIAGGMSPEAAHAKVMRDDPDLRDAYVAEHNKAAKKHPNRKGRD